MARPGRWGVFVSLALTVVLAPGVGFAEADWTKDARWSLRESEADGTQVGSAGPDVRLAALGPGSVMVARAGAGAAGAQPDRWHFTLASSERTQR